MEILDQQIEALIKQAPDDGVTATLITIIAPLLKQTADSLRYPEYHVLQGRGEGWIVTTLSNRTQPTLEKSVIYAFSTRENAQEYGLGHHDDETLIVSVPIIHMLFQLIALQTVHSVIFFDQSDGPGQGIEIRCSDFRHQVQARLSAHRSGIQSTSRISPPPDIA